MNVIYAIKNSASIKSLIWILLLLSVLHRKYQLLQLSKQIGNTFSFLVQRTEQIMKSLFYLTKRTYKVFMQNVLKLILLCCSQLISCVSPVIFSRAFQFSLVSVRTKTVFSILSYWCFCILFEQAKTFGKQSCWKFLIVLKDLTDEVAGK